MVLEEGILEVVLVIIGEFSKFSTFGVKLFGFWRVSRAGVVVEGVWGLGTTRDGVCEEKSPEIAVISL